ncbi:hypothetical protein [Brucella pituitosa]
MMLSKDEKFLAFLSALKNQNIIEDYDIMTAFKHLDGLEGVLKEQYFILASEALGRAIARQLSSDEIVRFIERNSNLLSEDEEMGGYYFLEALLDQWVSLNSNKGSDLMKIVNISPEKYRPFLRKKFLL